jgi:hypothetical protein
MKRDSSADELVAQWTLLPNELALLGNKTGATRLGFAVLLKFFQVCTALLARLPADTQAQLNALLLKPEVASSN